MKLWSAQAVSLVGDQISLLALPLTAILVLRASAVQMGVLVALGGLPSLLFAFVVGAWIDRHARRPVMLAADVGRFVLLGAIPVIRLFGLLNIGILYIATFLVGFLSLSFEVANRSLLPSLVSRNQLIDANGKLELSRSVSELASPALAGGLVQLLSAPFAISFDALSFLLSAMLLRTIGVREETRGQQARPFRLWTGIGDGIRFVMNQPVIRAVFAASGTLSFFSSMLEAVFLLYLARSLGLSAGVIGLVAAAGNVGFLVGATVTPRVDWLGAGPAIISGVIVLGIGDLIVPLLTSTSPMLVPILIGAHFLFGLGLTLYNINQVSARQSFTPDGYLGRVNAGYRFLVSGVGPLGALVGGGLGVALGFRAVLILSACGEIAAVLWLLLAPVRSLSSLSVGIESSEIRDATEAG